jgi:hypothetical protein
MLLRFEGGACDGYEEEVDATPEQVVLAVDAVDFLRSLVDEAAEQSPERFLAVYQLIDLDREHEIAWYEPLG